MTFLGVSPEHQALGGGGPVKKRFWQVLVWLEGAVLLPNLCRHRCMCTASGCFATHCVTKCFLSSSPGRSNATARREGIKGFPAGPWTGKQQQSRLPSGNAATCARSHAWLIKWCEHRCKQMPPGPASTLWARPGRTSLVLARGERLMFPDCPHKETGSAYPACEAACLPLQQVDRGSLALFLLTCPAFGREASQTLGASAFLCLVSEEVPVHMKAHALN